MTDYLYGSGRVRALEKNLLGDARIGRMPDAKTEQDLFAALNECGITPIFNPENGAFEREKTLLSILQDAYRDVTEIAAGDEAITLWLYPYDCNNVKAAIKGFMRGIDPGSMLFDFGSVKPEEVLHMVGARNFTGLPPAMKKVAGEAMEAYAKTHNPQKIDLILDRACYADMLRAAIESGSEYVENLVRTKIDLINVMSIVRILRMQSGKSGKAFLAESLLEGGLLPLSELKQLADEGESALWYRLQYHPVYGKFAEAVSAGSGTLTAVECAADNCWMDFVRKAKQASFGVEVPVGYLIAREYEVRNLRIVFAAREAKLSSETIRERIRENYV